MKISGKVEDFDTRAKWGQVTGDINNQADLVNLVNSKDEYYAKQIQGETISRISADNSLSSNISKEANIREAADGEIKLKIDSCKSDLLTKINAESKSRVAGDTESKSYTDGKISAVNSTINSVKNSLNTHANNSYIHVSTEDRSKWDNKSEFSGDYRDLRNQPDIPSKLSQLTNDEDFVDSSYVTEKVSPKANNSDLLNHTSDNSIHVNNDERIYWNNKLSTTQADYIYKKLQEEYDSNTEEIGGAVDNFISRIYQDKNGNITAVRSVMSTADYPHLTNKPKINGVELLGDLSTGEIGIDIPENLSDLNNDSGFITNEVNDLENYYLKSEVYNNSETYDKLEVLDLLSHKQDLITASDGIVKEENNLKLNLGDTLVLSDGLLGTKLIDILVDGESALNAEKTKAEINISGKQDKLTAGENIHIVNNVISASSNIGVVYWGNVRGQLSSQTDLYNILSAKVNRDALATVATTGQYSSLINPPTKLSQFSNDAGYITSIDGIVKSVKVEGTSVVSGTTANITYPTNTVPGVVNQSGSGATVVDGNITITKASSSDIDGRNSYNSIVPDNIDYAVKSALLKTDYTYNTTEQSVVRSKIGAASDKLATSSTAGLVKVGTGLSVDSGVVSVDVADEDDISLRSSNKIIDAENLDFLVKDVLTDGETYTEEESEIVRNKIGAASTDYATSSEGGLVIVTGVNGITISNGEILANAASATGIRTRSGNNDVIKISNYDLAVRDALCYSSYAPGVVWSDSEQLNARNKLGVNSLAAGSGIVLSVSNNVTTISATGISLSNYVKSASLESTGTSQYLKLTCIENGTEVIKNFIPSSSSAVTSVNGKTGEVVLKTSDLTNDSGFITDSYHDSAKQDLITDSNKLSYALLSDTPTINSVSGTFSGNNWSIITIDGVEKNIPSGGTGAVSSVNGETGDVTIDAVNVFSQATYTAAQKKAIREALGIYVSSEGTTPSGMEDGDILITY